MFKVNQQANRITPVKVKQFGELGFTERKHLQEWLAHQPDALGEELLVIQKEFDGFDETRERLDLLALDKDGNLVIIENKLDDSGRDVVWQALKYASYCASLTKAQIIDIFQQYLLRYPPVSDGQGEGSAQLDAVSRICEFLNAPDLDEVKLNQGNSQRLMLVAANFRKEVTSTVLWLLAQGLSIQCFKVTPYSLGEEVLINIDQVIPTPEAKDFVISIKAKEAEERSTEVVLKNAQKKRMAYWEQLLEVFQPSNCTLYDNISPAKGHWLAAGSGLGGCTYTLIFLNRELRVELYISRSNQAENKFVFDFLHEHKAEIDAAFGAPLGWMRLNDSKACRIHYACPIEEFSNDSWSDCIQWHLKHVTQLERALKGPLAKAAEALKKKNFE